MIHFHWIFIKTVDVICEQILKTPNFESEFVHFVQADVNTK